MTLDERIMDIGQQIVDVATDATLGAMERDAKRLDLQGAYASLKALKAGLEGDSRLELSWIRQVSELASKHRNAVLAQAQDLLPKILDQQEEATAVSRELEALQ